MNPQQDKRKPGRGAVVSRVLAALLGGYLFTWGFSALGISGLVTLGVDFHESQTAIMLLAFMLFPGMFLWAFAAASLLRVWGVLAGGGAVMTGAGWALQQMLLG